MRLERSIAARAFGLSFPELLTLLGALVLGVACLNFANLATARAAARGKEVSLRKAIGAARRQVMAQHLTETALTSAGAAALAMALLEFGLAVVVVVAEQNAALRRASLALGADPLVVIPLWLSDAGIDPELFRNRLLESPHVLAVSATGVAPWEEVIGGTGFTRTPNEASSFRFTQQQSVSYGYFEALGTRLLAGRSFSRSYADAGAHIVIDERAAVQFGWPNPADAIGQTIYESSTPQAAPKTIVGVVAHAPTRVTGGQMSSAFIYRLDERAISLPIIKISSANVATALAHIDEVWRSLAPTLPIQREFADERFARVYALFEHVNRAFTAIAGIAIAISALGLFGMAAYIVGRRRREIGIRKSQGAAPQRLFGMLLGQFLRPVIVGNLLALPIAFVAARAYLGLFVQPVPLSPSPFLVGAVTTLLVATAVVAYQVFRAVRVTPAALLRQE